MDFTLPDFLIFCGSTLLMAMLLMELLDWSCILAAFDCPSRGGPNQFFYGDNSGPNFWRCNYPESRGCEQSPINIVERTATVLTPCDPLCWRGYSDEPCSMNLANDGNTVKLVGFWTCPARPTLQGGPLKTCYDFHSIVFRWGPSDDEGSEHSIDYSRYPMEMQVVHVKRGLNVCQEDSTVRRMKDSLAVVTFFFQIMAVDNPYFDHIITNLWRVATPGACVDVPAFPLEWLFPTFEGKFYTYTGSLTEPPCSEIVVWIVQPTPVCISANQLSQFRKVCSTEGPILSNSRPVQKLNDREIFYFS